MDLQDYFEKIQEIQRGQNATEHSYRPVFQAFLERLAPDLQFLNEPKRIACGSPDFLVEKGDVSIGYIETKDWNTDLETTEKSEQIQRYLQSLDNLILTNYLEFRFYQNSQKIKEVCLAKWDQNQLQIIQENWGIFKKYFENFCHFQAKGIKNSEELSSVMANKALLMKEVFYQVLLQENENNSLQQQFQGFQKYLIQDLDKETFADVYVQTLVYGLFSASLNCQGSQNFTRQTARDLVPQSSFFLRHLFDNIAGVNLDERLHWVIDDLAQVLQDSDLANIFQATTHHQFKSDPFLDFYEHFLAAYDSEKRKEKGVYYTPKPVVHFIVKAVDDLLKKEFQIQAGLADCEKVGKKTNGKAESLHRLQILDPATGTGAFLAEVIEHIQQSFQNQQGLWSSYVKEHLIPRLNGFEIMMAPYALCHLKLAMMLKQTGYSDKDRFKIFLTNALSEYHSQDMPLLTDHWLIQESKGADSIKRDIPVMVVLGNPPYHGESQNQSDWIMNLINVYKKEPTKAGQTEDKKIQEKNSKWLNDDYVKFIRCGQFYVQKNGSGILAFINNHSFIDNPTFRGMRWNLLKTFDKIYILDLHGNSRKKEISPDGSKDENVFKIMQGVSINLFVKNENKQTDDLAQVFHYDLYGKRTDKLNFLQDNTLDSIEWSNVKYQSPNYFFVPKNLELQKDYEQGFSLKDLFILNSVGIVTARDHLTIHHTQKELEKIINKFLSLENEEARKQFNLRKDVRDWTVKYAREDLEKNYPNRQKIVEIIYRPFDKRWTFYTGKVKGFHCKPRRKVMQNFLKSENLGLISIRRSRNNNIWREIFITNSLSCGATTISSLDINYVFPLYTYPENQSQNNTEKASRKPNFNEEIIQKIEKNLGLKFTVEKEESAKYFAPIDLLDYIYAVLHSSKYRERYQEFLKIDFPHIPYPKKQKTFWELAKLGKELRLLHLMEHQKLNHFITTYPEDGEHLIEKVSYEQGKVWINNKQYFGSVPEAAWNFYIGGYQPAQKWLKDRKGRKLTFDDIQHYQKIIVALVETDKTMQQIQNIEFH